MKRLIASIALLVGLGAAQVATAACTIANEKEMQCLLSWVEPTLNTDDSLIKDLDSVSMFYRIGTTGPWVFIPPPYPATSPTGGGTVSQFPVLVPVAEGQLDVTVEFSVIANAMSGLSSARGPFQAVVLNHPKSMAPPRAPVLLPILTGDSISVLSP